MNVQNSTQHNTAIVSSSQMKPFFVIGVNFHNLWQSYEITISKVGESNILTLKLRKMFYFLVCSFITKVIPCKIGC